MSPDRLSELLRQADAEVGKSPPLADLVGHVVRRHQGRRRRLQLAQSAAAILVMAVTLSVMLKTFDRMRTAAQSGAATRALVEGRDRAAESGHEWADADVRLALARRVAEIQRRDERMAVLQAELRRPDPRQVVRQEVDLAATVLVQQADHLYRDLGLKKPAAENYRQVVRLFPDTAPAAVARERLKQLDSESKGDS